MRQSNYHTKLAKTSLEWFSRDHSFVFEKKKIVMLNIMPRSRSPVLHVCFMKNLPRTHSTGLYYRAISVFFQELSRPERLVDVTATVLYVKKYWLRNWLVLSFFCTAVTKRTKKKYNPRLLILWGTIVNRTYGTHKNLFIYPLLLLTFGPVYFGPP